MVKCIFFDKAPVSAKLTEGELGLGLGKVIMTHKDGPHHSIKDVT